MIGHRDCFQFDGSQPNISIDKFMSGKQRQFWRGPIAVVSSTIREDGDEDGGMYSSKFLDLGQIARKAKEFFQSVFVDDKIASRNFLSFIILHSPSEF